ncbi:hypothetical protein P43SY_008245 [Pythium insidiosum]|uniref:Transmembrane protein n=1 Tax=Pythium insidiosum TaxID=114742 RepID=A0AAD5Q723_PYTIN|nr:hypothetical protein P43SY_008245 [Pythium insidiosum]
MSPTPGASASRRHAAPTPPPRALSPAPSEPRKLSRALRHRTFRVDGLVALTTAAKAGAALVLAFFVFGNALLFCVIALGSYYVLMEYTASADVLDWAQLERRLQRRALRLDDYLRLFVAKLARVWQSLLALQKSTVDYSLTVSIAETESMLELSQLLETKRARLSIDAEQTICRERVFSVEKSVVTELPLPLRIAAPASHLPALKLAVELGPVQPPSAQNRSKDTELLMTPAVRLIQVTETLEPRRFVPTAGIAQASLTVETAAPVAMPSPASKPPSPKRVVSVVFPAQIQRIVIRPRPAKLTLSQSVHRMLLDVERMTREANALLSAGEAVVPSDAPAAPRRESRRKSVRFDDHVTLCEGANAVPEDPTELFFGRDEIESMCNEYFGESSGVCEEER